MLLTLLTAVVNGLNRYDISSLITAGMGALTTLGAAALLLMGYGLVHIVILNVVMPALAAGIYFRTGKRLFPQLKFRPRWRLDVFRQILGFGMYALLGRITDVIVRQVDLLIIGALLGVSSVTYYVIPFTILNRMTALVGRIGMVIFPAVSELQGQHQRDRIEALYLTSSRMILALATAFCVPLLICGPRFLYLWMNPEFAERGSLPMLLITAGVFFDLWTNVPTFVVDGMGRPKISGLAAVSQAAIFLALMVPMALWKGITGVAGAFLISMATVGPVFAWYVNHHIMAMTVRRLFHTSYLRPLAAGIITAVPLLLLPMERVTNIFVLLAILAAGFFGYFIVAFALGVFEQRERRVIGEYFQRAWRRMTKRGETP
jgi:O-antigen/teichoic acid export membrane protein